jgi:hypothetical protein
MAHIIKSAISRDQELPGLANEKFRQNQFTGARSSKYKSKGKGKAQPKAKDDPAHTRKRGVRGASRIQLKHDTPRIPGGQLGVVPARK